MRRHWAYMTVMITQAVWICGWAISSLAADPAPKSGADPQLLKAANANNEFACDLYRKAAVREGNLFFSPVSISCVLGMLEAGAGNESDTQKEIRTVLHLPVPDPNLSPEENRRNETILFRQLDKSGVRFRLKSASRIWGRPELENKINADYQKDLQKYYSADFAGVNFDNRTEAVDDINRWVSENTNGNIPKLDVGIVPADVQLVVTNAVYLYGPWIHRFDQVPTQKKTFYVPRQKPSEVLTMIQNNRFRYWKSPTVQAIELPCEGDAFSAIVLLPTDRAGLPELENQLNATNLNKWLSNLDSSVDAKTKEPPMVRLQLPKFNYSSEMPDLDNYLQQLGIKTAFGPRADLSGIAADKSMYISKMIHKAFVGVDEKGIKAGAVTLGAVSSSRPPQLPEFVVDHPFLLLIRDQKSGAILFLGRVENPGEEAVAAR